MNHLIKEIRDYLAWSQMAMAAELNIAFATVNRWENGHAIPNKTAQHKLYELCRAHHVPVYDFVLKKFSGIVNNLSLDEDRILLYHASKSGLEGPIAPKSRKQCDFGRGFYMSDTPEQALTLICDYEEAKLYIVSLCTANLNCVEIPVDIDWAMAVAYHRGKMESVKGSALYQRYAAMTGDKDLVIGSIVNDRMFFVIDNFFAGNITDAALLQSLSKLQFGKQYAAVSQTGCNAVRIECEIPLSYLERACIKDVAAERRMKGISMATDICKAYRREGKFFDEIVGGEG